MQHAFDFRLTTESAPAFLTHCAHRSTASETLDKNDCESSSEKDLLHPSPFFVIARDHALAGKKKAQGAAQKPCPKRRSPAAL